MAANCSAWKVRSNSCLLPHEGDVRLQVGGDSGLQMSTDLGTVSGLG